MGIGLRPINATTDMRETLRATEVLVKEGFEPMVYCVDDPIAAKQLEEAGAVAIMPLGAPIGSGLGIQNRVTIRLIVEGAGVPVLVDAGVGTRAMRPWRWSSAATAC